MSSKPSTDRVAPECWISARCPAFIGYHRSGGEHDHLHAWFRREGINSRYPGQTAKEGADNFWELGHTLKQGECPAKDGVEKSQLLHGDAAWALRKYIEHQLVARKIFGVFEVASLPVKQGRNHGHRTSEIHMTAHDRSLTDAQFRFHTIPESSATNSSRPPPSSWPAAHSRLSGVPACLARQERPGRSRLSRNPFQRPSPDWRGRRAGDGS